MTQQKTGVYYSNVSNPPLPLIDSTLPLPPSAQTKDQLWQSTGQFPLLNHNPSQFPHYNSISNRVTENSTNFLWNLSNGIPHNTTLYIYRRQSVKEFQLVCQLPKKRFSFHKCALVLTSVFGPPTDKSCKMSNNLQGENT